MRTPRPRRKTTGPAICPTCNGVYRLVDGCQPDAMPNARLWGREPWFTDEYAAYIGTDEGGPYEPLERCPDCAALVGHHHHPGCCKAHCTVHDNQHIQCCDPS